MIIDSPRTILYIKPQYNPSPKPLIDIFTVKVFNAYMNHIEYGCLDNNLNFVRSVRTNKFYKCCSASVLAYDYVLPNGQFINSLCVHYIALHRDEISKNELDKIESINIPNDTSKKLYNVNSESIGESIGELMDMIYL